MMKFLFSLSIVVLVCFQAHASTISVDNPFLGMWTIDVEGGGVGWLHVHENQGYLDAELLWKGGSVTPVGHVYLANKNTLVVTRTNEFKRGKDASGEDRMHPAAHVLRAKLIGEQLMGSMVGPHWRGGEMNEAFIGRRLEAPGRAPDLTAAKYGRPIELFNGENLEGWKIIDPEHKNGFKAMNGDLVNDPVQKEGAEHIHYGNLRTDDVYDDFNLTLEVNVPEGNNSGIYLRGIYEVQVFDSYGKDVDSHHMGAVYSRMTPSIAAEKPGGSWQSLDITLYKRHITVILNGKNIIDNQPVLGPTGGAISSDVFAAGPIYLQGDHGNVSYRNLVLTPILNNG